MLNSEQPSNGASQRQPNSGQPPAANKIIKRKNQYHCKHIHYNNSTKVETNIFGQTKEEVENKITQIENLYRKEKTLKLLNKLCWVNYRVTAEDYNEIVELMNEIKTQQ